MAEPICECYKPKTPCPVHPNVPPTIRVRRLLEYIRWYSSASHGVGWQNKVKCEEEIIEIVSKLENKQKENQQ